MSAWMAAASSLLGGVAALFFARLLLAGGVKGQVAAAMSRVRLEVGWGRLSRALGRMRNDASARWDALQRTRSRRALTATCLDELPELLDVLALGLSAGISFDASLSVYCERYNTMLAGRMADAMRSWQLGVASRRDALRSLAGELSVDAFSTFVSTVTDSLALGTPLAQVLVAQSEAVRDARRSYQQESIEKTPVKMLVPIGTLILPAMLLSILGPLLASLAVSA